MLFLCYAHSVLIQAPLTLDRPRLCHLQTSGSSSSRSSSRAGTAVATVRHHRLTPVRAQGGVAAGGQGADAALNPSFEGAEFKADGSGSSAGGAAGPAAGSTSSLRPRGWQRRWGMVAMCFVAFMVSVVGAEPAGGAAGGESQGGGNRGDGATVHLRWCHAIRTAFPLICAACALMTTSPCRCTAAPYLRTACQLCNMDRVNMSIAILPISQQYQWNAATIGLVQSSFFWGYLLTQVGAGCGRQQ